MKPNLMHGARLIAPLMLLAMPLAGCQTILKRSQPIPITAGVPAVPCRDLRQLSFDGELDTQETIRDLRRQNAVISAVCK